MYAFSRVLLCVVAFTSIRFSQLHAADQVAPRLVHVTGSGTVKVVPDIVFVSLTMTAVDDDLLRVRESSDKTARGALDLAKKNGVSEDGIEVSRLDLSLDFNKQLNRQIYQVRRDATIKLADLAKLDSLLSDLLRQPNLTVVKITFDTSKQRQHELAALSQAVVNAREQAEFLANLHGFKLGKASDIRIDSESEQPFVTSVVPVVGQAEKSTDTRIAGPRHGSSFETAGSSSASRTTPFRLVALDAPNQPAGNSEKPAGVRPFALGQITIAAKVSVDYELVR